MMLEYLYILFPIRIPWLNAILTAFICSPCAHLNKYKKTDFSNVRGCFVRVKKVFSRLATECVDRQKYSWRPSSWEGSHGICPNQVPASPASPCEMKLRLRWQNKVCYFWLTKTDNSGDCGDEVQPLAPLDRKSL